MVTGNGTSSSSAATFDSNTTNALTDQRHHNLHDTSPLQIFVRAKKKINDIFGEIEEYVIETTRFIDGN